MAIIWCIVLITELWCGMSPCDMLHTVISTSAWLSKSVSMSADSSILNVWCNSIKAKFNLKSFSYVFKPLDPGDYIAYYQSYHLGPQGLKLTMYIVNPALISGQAPSEKAEDAIFFFKSLGWSYLGWNRCLYNRDIVRFPHPSQQSCKIENGVRKSVGKNLTFYVATYGDCHLRTKIPLNIFWRGRRGGNFPPKFFNLAPTLVLKPWRCTVLYTSSLMDM